MKHDDNPFCSQCGFRTYPQWGPHECKQNVKVTDDEIRRVRHTAGDMLSNLHFYRIPPDLAIAATAEALAFTLASNVAPDRLEQRWLDLKKKIWKLIRTQVDRQEKGTNAENVVMDVNKPRMVIKKKKEKKPNAKLQSRGYHRRRRR